MADEQPPVALDELDARLQKIHNRRETGKGQGGRLDAASQSAVGMAWRIGVEVLAAMVVGVGSGLLLDHWLGSRPFGLVGMFLLGAAAGVLNVYRTVNNLGYAPGYRAARGSSQPQSPARSRDDGER